MAVVDDGVDGSHLELAPNYVRGSLLFYCYCQLVIMEKLMFMLTELHAFATFARLSVVPQVAQS